MTKKELRNIYLQKRMSIPSKERSILDDLLLIQFQRLVFDEVSTLLSYWPMAEKAEPNTLLFSSYLRHAVSDLQIAYPINDLSSNTMQAVLINEDTVYHTDRYGITQPKEGEIIGPEMIDLVLVPLLAFNQQGLRIGYGKGFYDKYLQLCREDVLKIGLSYFDPVDNIEDVQPFDVPLNYCVTPRMVHEF